MLKKSMPALLVLLLTCSYLWPANLPAAEEKNHLPVIAVLLYSKHFPRALEGFKAGLREKGYIEGENISYLFNGPTEKIEALDAAMDRLLAGQPDLIFAVTTPAACAARRATRANNIPVVFAPVNDPIAAGLTQSIKHPGENITGVMVADSEGKRLQWTTEIAPYIQTVLLPYNPNDKSSMKSLQNVRAAGAVLGLKIIAEEVRNNKDIRALINHCPEGIDSIFLPCDALIESRIDDFVALSLAKKIILSVTRREMLEKGALFNYGFDSFKLGKQAARLADQILKGTKPEDLPIEIAEEYFDLNLKTADAIGLPISEYILRLAHLLIRAPQVDAGAKGENPQHAIAR
ncbi:MAG: ABC transporter substrate-binding protein [Proteobacteria bacterium]|nr:ABC transporter substrate-binding protein [Pseudomonadota bacterium]MBU4296203.1 ABC transporter substrate-binding protein [Pseudomonadota bacterium]MCG2748609.1 ABC transporter substrate-binding protein [Desulfobulbaceae bacterium]